MNDSTGRLLNPKPHMAQEQEQAHESAAIRRHELGEE